MSEPTKSRRGGVPGNKGGGRRAVDGAHDVVRVSICIEPHQRAQLAALGGSSFVRRALRDAAGTAPTGPTHGRRASR